MTLNIYDDAGNIVRTAEGEMVAIRFGVVRKLMGLLNIGKEEGMDVLTTVANAWDEIIKLLGTVFPDIQDDEWDNVDITELIPVMLEIVKKSVSKMSQLPTDPNKKGA